MSQSSLEENTEADQVEKNLNLLEMFLGFTFSHKTEINLETSSGPCWLTKYLHFCFSRCNELLMRQTYF